MEEGGEDAAVAAVVGARLREGNVGFEERYKDSMVVARTHVIEAGGPDNWASPSVGRGLFGSDEDDCHVAGTGYRFNQSSLE